MLGQECQYHVLFCAVLWLWRKDFEPPSSCKAVSCEILDDLKLIVFDAYATFQNAGVLRVK